MIELDFSLQDKLFDRLLEAALETYQSEGTLFPLLIALSKSRPPAVLGLEPVFKKEVPQAERTAIMKTMLRAFAADSYFLATETWLSMPHRLVEGQRIVPSTDPERRDTITAYGVYADGRRRMVVREVENGQLLEELANIDSARGGDVRGALADLLRD